MPPLTPVHEPERVATQRPDRDEAFSSVVSGTLVPLRRHRAWHVLGLCTGLVLLPHGFGALARLLGLRRRTTLKVEPDALVVESRVELLGSTVTHTDLRLRHEAVTGAAISRAQPAGLLLVGAIVGLAIALLGVKFLGNGILVKAASLTLAGAGVVCLGIGVDLAVFALGRFLAGRRGVSISVVAHGSPLVTISGVEPARATRFVRALLGTRAPAADAVPVPIPVPRG
jgi:hypothetical protein